MNYDFYLKYRHKESAKSNILGCVNLKKSDDYMWYANASLLIASFLLSRSLRR